MKPKEGESFESWAARARMYEQGVAMQKIAQGEDPEKVLEELSRRLLDKLLHPIYKEIRESCITAYDSDVAKREYEEKYLKNYTPVADHVAEDFFDNSDEK